MLARGKRHRPRQPHTAIGNSATVADAAKDETLDMYRRGLLGCATESGERDNPSRRVTFDKPRSM
jgi:hypothetical protein